VSLMWWWWCWLKKGCRVTGCDICIVYKSARERIMSDWTWNNKSKLKNMNSHYIPCRFRRNVKFRDQSGRIPGLHPDSGRNTRGRVKTSSGEASGSYALSQTFVKAFATSPILGSVSASSHRTTRFCLRSRPLARGEFGSKSNNSVERGGRGVDRSCVWIKIGVGRKAKAWPGAVGTITTRPVPPVDDLCDCLLPNGEANVG
jgi:hypothetical protein